MMESNDLEALGTYVDVGSALQGVTIDPEWRSAVVANMATIRRAAHFVEGYLLDDEAEPAPLFTP